MASIFRLTDTDTVHLSNMCVGGLYILVADQLPEKEKRMATWLYDLWDRGAPFMDFDLRELPHDSRNAFIEAGIKAFSILEEKYAGNPPDNSYAYIGLRDFVEKIKRIKSTNPDYPNVEFEGEQVDFDELWK